MNGKILVTGGNGQLGSALKQVLKDEEVLYTDSDDMDITDPKAIEETFARFNPTVLIHGAAFTNVDGCEENPELAKKVNATGTENLAKACKDNGALMIYISTDYVFDGTKNEPYVEEDAPNPQSVYGKTKLDGEKLTREIADGYVIRTSWVYGEGKNFVRTMLGLSEKMDEVSVVSDQMGRPTYALDLAKSIFDVINKQPMRGIYHVTGDGEPISWADFAEMIFKTAGKVTKVKRITTKEYFAQYPGKTIAPRPAFSTLSLDRAKGVSLYLRDWSDAAKEYITKEMTSEQ